MGVVGVSIVLRLSSNGQISAAALLGAVIMADSRLPPRTLTGAEATVLAADYYDMDEGLLSLWRGRTRRDARRFKPRTTSREGETEKVGHSHGRHDYGPKKGIFDA